MTSKQEQTHSPSDSVVTKDSWFFASFEVYKMAEEKNGPNAFRTGAKIPFSEKNILGFGPL